MIKSGDSVTERAPLGSAKREVLRRIFLAPRSAGDGELGQTQGMLLKSSALVLGVVALFSGCAPQAAPAVSGRKIVPKGAVSFTSKNQRFSIWLPVKPFQSSQVAGIVDAKLVTLFIFQTKTKPIAYAVIVSPKPPQVDVAEPTGPLDAMERGSLKSSQGIVQKRADIQLSGFPGRELKTSVQKGAVTTRTRMFLTPRNSYQIIAGGSTTEMQKQSAQIDKVFDSFRILPQ